MKNPRERILIVESDPEISDVIARQTLQPMGYQVEVVGGAGQAIQEALKTAPDVILASLNLPGLSGKDLLVALSSQGLDVPIIVIAQKGMEGDVIQAFRLGATDYLGYPIREAEVLSAVERVLKQGSARREKEELARQLQKTNQELQRRVRELTTIFAIGKAVTSITSQRLLLDQIMEGAVYVTEADMGWLLLREEKGKNFLLSACRNLPKSIMDKTGQPWEDGISSLVALSGESLTIYGEPLKRFKVSSLGQSALVVPVKAKKEVIGLLVVVRKAPKPFGANNQTLLEALADYSSISLLNSRLFKELEDRARTLQGAADLFRMNDALKNDLLRSLALEISEPLATGISTIDRLSADGQTNPYQVEQLRIVRHQLKQVEGLMGSLADIQRGGDPTQRGRVDITLAARAVIARFQKPAQEKSVGLVAELTSRPVLVHASETQMIRVFEGLLSNAIKHSPVNGTVNFRIEILDKQACALIRVSDSGKGLNPDEIQHLFDRKPGTSARMLGGGIGIGLALIRDVVNVHGGRVWAESKSGNGAEIFVSLPLVKET